MSRLPRLAIGSVQCGVSCQPMAWAVMELVKASGRQVQSFLSRACFAPIDGAKSITGVRPRHLDSWLMTKEVCRELFAHGAASADLAVVEGEYLAARCADNRTAETVDQPGVAGGRLDCLCEWLDLPRLVVLDSSRIDECSLPARPLVAHGLLIDRLADDGQFVRAQTKLESLWGVPVLGVLGELGPLRAAMEALPAGSTPPEELCRALGRSLARHTCVGQLLALAARRDFSAPPEVLFRRRSTGRAARVAVAFDDAFYCYFPDVLDLLDASGVQTKTFSPLRDDTLPPGTDIVYLGCGHPERYAAALAENHCMSMALRAHVREGRRIYAEGGALAYLCRELDVGDGERRPMVGALPARAHRNRSGSPPEPVSLTLMRDTWLAPAGATLRGYRNPTWRIEPTEPLTPLVRDTGHYGDLWGVRRLLASNVHLNFVAHADCLRRFVESESHSAAPRC